MGSGRRGGTGQVHHKEIGMEGFQKWALVIILSLLALHYATN